MWNQTEGILSSRCFEVCCRFLCSLISDENCCQHIQQWHSGWMPMRARTPGVSNCDTGIAVFHEPQYLTMSQYHAKTTIYCYNIGIVCIKIPCSHHPILPLSYRTATALFIMAEFSSAHQKHHCFLFCLYCITQSTEIPWLEYSFEVNRAEACLLWSVVTLGYCL